MSQARSSEKTQPATEQTGRVANLIVYPIGELATARSFAGKPAHGAQMGQVRRIKQAALAVRGGKILAAGKQQEVLAQVERSPKTIVVDASGKLVTAGFVDPHTHLIFAGNRANEFAMRCQGKSYADIAAAGGGIVASMNPTRNATIEQLVASGLQRLARMLTCGTTTCEVKTGYGLEKSAELRMLEAILTLNQVQPVELVPTFMPAHAFPPAADRQEYIATIVQRMLPAAKELAAAFAPDAPIYNDVFCDHGYFSLEETRLILSEGKKLGLQPRVHADEFANLGACKLAVELGAASADHLLNTSDDDIQALSRSQTVAVLLPGTSFFLNLAEHARARKMIDSGVAVALGSDFNPGSCHIYSMPFIFGLACLHLQMTVEEALTAVTYNAACAISASDRLGTLEPGRQADFLIHDLSTLEEIPYTMVGAPIRSVYKRGNLVFQRIGE